MTLASGRTAHEVPNTQQPTRCRNATMPESTVILNARPTLSDAEMHRPLHVASSKFSIQVRKLIAAPSTLLANACNEAAQACCRCSIVVFTTCQHRACTRASCGSFELSFELCERKVRIGPPTGRKGTYQTRLSLLHMPKRDSLPSLDTPATTVGRNHGQQTHRLLHPCCVVQLRCKGLKGLRQRAATDSGLPGE